MKRKKRQGERERKEIKGKWRELNSLISLKSIL
jgi:hypothetical protein